MILFFYISSANAQILPENQDPIQWQVSVHEENSFDLDSSHFLKWSSLNYPVLTSGQKYYAAIKGKFDGPVKIAKLNDKPFAVNEVGEFELKVIVKQDSKIRFNVFAENVNGREYKMQYVLTSVDPAEKIYKTTVKRFQEEYSRWKLSSSFDFFFTRIDATDLNTLSTANFISQYNTGLSLKLTRNLTKKFQPYLTANFRLIQFVPAFEKSIASDFLTPWGLGIGVNYHWSERIQARGQLLYQQSIFLKGLSESEVTFDSKGTPQGHILIDWNAIQSQASSVGLEGCFKYILGSKANGYTSSSSTGFGSKLYYKSQSQNSSLRVSLVVESEKLKTNLVQQNSINWGGDLTLDFNLN